MAIHPLRSDKQYLEIENFKAFELSQCVAYEMAIRNPELKDMKKEQSKYDVQADFDEAFMKKLNQTSNKEEMNKVLMEFMFSKPERLEMFEKNEVIKEKILQLSFFSLPSDSTNEAYKLLEIPSFLSYLKRTSQREQLKKTSISKDGRINSFFEDDGNAKTITGANIKYGELFPAFSRPFPVIPAEVSKEIDIVLNLALPMDDIISYVKTIKDSYDKSNGEAFKTVSSLENIATINKEISTIWIKTKKKGSKINIEMPEKSKQEVYADLFFLYDVFSDVSFKKKVDMIHHFRSEMIDYYAQKVCKYHGLKDIDDVSGEIGTPRDQSIREYYKVMQQYIDGFGYKKLIV